MEKGRDEHRERKKESQDDREQRKEKYRQRESNREDDYQRHRKDRERSRSNEKKAPRFKQDSRQLKPYKSEPQQEDSQPKKLFVSCRRCKQMTFSLVNRTCSSCGYPKQTRPAYFPIAKQTQVLDLVREGKLTHNSYAPVLIQVVVNDRMGKRQRIKCCPTDTILQFKKLISAQIGTRPEKIRLQKGNVIYKDHITLGDYEIKDGMGLEMYYD